MLTSLRCVNQNCTNAAKKVEKKKLTIFYLNKIVIELACAEYGEDKISLMVNEMMNGESLDWFDEPDKVLKLEMLRKKYPLNETNMGSDSIHATSKTHQLKILLQRSLIKARRDATLTHLRCDFLLII